MPRRKEKCSLFERIQKMETESSCRPSSLNTGVFKGRTVLSTFLLLYPTPSPLPCYSSKRKKRVEGEG